MLESDIYWLAGLLEGEGSFIAPPPSEPNKPRISIAMTDKDIIKRVANLFGLSYIYESKDKRSSKWKPYFQVVFKGKRAAVLMRSLQPLMGERRRQQIDEALKDFVPREPGYPKTKLIREQVLQLRERLRSGEKIAVIARDLGVSRDVVRKVRDGKIWKSII